MNVELDILSKLQDKIVKATHFIEELQAENIRLGDEGKTVQSLMAEIDKLRAEKALEEQNNSKREIVIKSKIEEIIKKLSILEPHKS